MWLVLTLANREFNKTPLYMCNMNTLSSVHSFSCVSRLGIVSQIIFSNPGGNNLGSFKSFAISRNGQHILAIFRRSTGSQYAYVSNDYGITFSTKSILTATSSSITRCKCQISNNGQNMVLSIYDGTARQVTVSTNGGTTWTNILIGLTVCMSDSGQFIGIRGDNPASIFINTNYGNTSFTGTARLTSNNSLSCASSSSGQYMYFASTAQNSVVRTSTGTDISGGLSTATFSLPIDYVSGDTRAVYCSNTGQRVIITGANSASNKEIMLSTDYGNTFTDLNNLALNAITTTARQKVNSFVCNDNGIVVFADDSGYIYRSTDYLANYQQYTTGTTVGGLSMSDDGKYVLYCSDVRTLNLITNFTL